MRKKGHKLKSVHNAASMPEIPAMTGEGDPKEETKEQVKESDEQKEITPAEKALEIFQGQMRASSIGPYLGKNKPFNAEVLVEFVKLYDFTGKSLDEALRHFLTKFTLTGESQEIDRIIEQFSKRYFENNPADFKNWTVVHTVISSMLILNTDLYSGMVEKKMTKSDFITNTNMALQDDEQLPDEFLKKIYNSIKSNEIVLTLDEDDPRRSVHSPLSRGFSTFSTKKSISTTTLSHETSSLYSRYSDFDQDSIQYGQLYRKCVFESRDKKSAHRQWKPFFVILNSTALYHYKPDNTGRISKDGKVLDVINIRHVLASFIQGYNEDRPFVFSLTTHLGAVYYFQCPTETNTFQWIDDINYVSARYSQAALAAAIGAQTKEFTPPILPSSTTSNSALQQVEYYENQIKNFDRDVFQHVQDREQISQGEGSVTLKKIAEWDKKMSYLNGELRRYNEYLNILKKRIAEEEEALSDEANETNETSEKIEEKKQETDESKKS